MSDVIPYSCQDISEADIAAVTAVLKSSFLTQGPAVPAFEEKFARLHDAAHAIAVSSATAGLHIACLALGAGPEDLVWTAPNSFVASANCARYCGSSVDFVDIDPATRCMSLTALETKLAQADAEGRLPKIVIPVDFAGFPYDLAPVRALADRYGFRIVADCSHAVGASCNGMPAGKLADISVFSFHPVKIITTGEGGMCLTDDPVLAQRLALLRSHGITRDADLMQAPTSDGWYYEQIALGYNYRLTDVQAALGLSQLDRHAERAARREELSQRYDRLLSGHPLVLPFRKQGHVSAHHLYVIEIDDESRNLRRDRIFAHLRANGIGVNVHYIPIHLQPDFRKLGFAPGDFPAAEAYYERAISIPLFSTMRLDQQDRVVAVLTEALSG